MDGVIRRLRLTADPPPKSPDPEFGAGVVVLKRLSEAIADGDHVRAANRALCAGH